MELDTQKIRVEIAKKELNAKQFCRINNFPYSTFMGIMSGNRVGNLKTVGKLAKALNVEISEILKN